MRKILASSLAIIALAACVSVASSAQKSKPKVVAVKAGSPPAYGNAEAITEHELRVYDYALANEQLEGRNAPSRGFDTAALYIASHLAEWGLKPGGSPTGTNGPLQPYFMPFELVSRSVVAEESKISITSPPAAGRGGRGGQSGPGGAASGPATGTGSPAGGPGGQGGGGRGTASGPRTSSFEYSKDWSLPTGGRGAPPLEALDISGNLVFVGDGYVVNKTKLNPYEGLDVKGKIVVVAGLPAELVAQQNAAAANGARGGRGGAGRAGAGQENAPGAPDTTAPPAAQPPAAPATPAPGAGTGPAAQNPLGEPCVDFLNPEQAAAKNGAIAVVTIANFQQLAAMANPNAGGFGGFGGGAGGRGGANGPAYQVAKFRPALACPVVPAVTAGIGLATAIFQGEKKTASQIFYAAGNNAKQDSFALNAETKISLKLSVKSTAGHIENVVGIIEGRDPVKKNEFVVISAHLDHIGLAAGANGEAPSVNAGADDDGSGCTALLAIARTYAEGAAKGMRPERSIIFLWNAGEEKGLWGSQYFNQFPPVDLSKVVADINVDMVGRTKGPRYTDSDPTHVLVNPGEIMVVGPNISSDDLGKTMETVNDSYQKLSLNHFYDTTAPDKTHDNLGPQPNGQRIFYRSDHYNFAKMGIPVVFFTDGLHPDYHRPTDTPEKIDFKQMLAVTKTVSAIGWVLSNQEGRPKLKEKLPEQLLKDMKIVKDQGWGKLTPVMAPLPGEPY